MSLENVSINQVVLGAFASPKVFEETVTEAKSTGYLAESASRIEKLFGKTVVVENPDYSDSLVSQIVDRVRKCIAKKSKKEEHPIELADLQIVALAASYAVIGKSVELVLRDKALKDCLEAAFQGQFSIGKVSIIDSSALVAELLSKRRG